MLEWWTGRRKDVHRLGEYVPANKEQIADEFQKQVERVGFERSSVEAVAAELGISKRTIYQHFASKGDLYAYVVDRLSDAEREGVERSIANEPTYRTKMKRYLQLVVRAKRVHTKDTAGARFVQESEVDYEAMSRAYRSVGDRLLEGGAAAGEFAFADARLASELMSAIVTRYGVLVWDRPDYDADDAIVAAIMRMLG
jgi:AcrR family transcriptional regulator